MPRGARKIPTTMLRRPQPASVGSTQLPPLVPPTPATRKRRPPKQGTAEPKTNLYAPAPTRTVTVGKAFRPPEQEANAVLGAAAPDTRPSALFNSRNEAAMNMATPIRKAPQA